MPEKSRDLDRYNFKTADDAFDYVASNRCYMCLEDIKINGDDATIACDAEWYVDKMYWRDWCRFLKIKCHIII